MVINHRTRLQTIAKQIPSPAQFYSDVNELLLFQLLIDFNFIHSYS